MSLALEPFLAILRQLGLGPCLVQPSTRLRPPLPRPRFPSPGTVADTVVGDHCQRRASIKAGRSTGRADSIFGANAVTACLAPLKLTRRGSIPCSAAATAITVRSRLYARRWAQISL